MNNSAVVADKALFQIVIVEFTLHHFLKLRCICLNIVGMKRRQMDRKSIHDLRAAYRLLFAQEGTFQERIDDVAELFPGSEEIKDIVAFIRAGSSRSICMPKLEH